MKEKPASIYLLTLVILLAGSLYFLLYCLTFLRIYFSFTALLAGILAIFTPIRETGSFFIDMAVSLAYLILTIVILSNKPGNLVFGLILGFWIICCISNLEDVAKNAMNYINWVPPRPRRLTGTKKMIDLILEHVATTRRVRYLENMIVPGAWLVISVLVIRRLLKNDLAD